MCSRKVLLTSYKLWLSLKMIPSFRPHTINIKLGFLGNTVCTPTVVDEIPKYHCDLCLSKT